MFRRLGKFDGSLFGGGAYMGGGRGGLIFEMLIGFHIWGRINGI